MKDKDDIYYEYYYNQQRPLLIPLLNKLTLHPFFKVTVISILHLVGFISIPITISYSLLIHSLPHAHSVWKSFSKQNSVCTARSYRPIDSTCFAILRSGSNMPLILLQYSLSIGGALQYASPSNFPPSFFLVSALRSTLPSFVTGLIRV
jgi:hypothetical protein